MCPTSIGRKLWLFFLWNATVERAARITNIFTSARIRGTYEREYLRRLLGEFAPQEWPSDAAIRLLPGAWLAAMKELKEGAAVEV